MIWFPNSWFYLSRKKCIVAMFSYFKKSEKKNLLREVYFLARCLVLNWSRRHAFIICHKNMKSMRIFFLQFFESFRGKYKLTNFLREMKNGLSLRQQQFITSDYVLNNHLSWAFHKLTSLQTKQMHRQKKRAILIFFFNSKRYRDFS